MRERCRGRVHPGTGGDPAREEETFLSPPHDPTVCPPRRRSVSPSWPPTPSVQSRTPSAQVLSLVSGTDTRWGPEETPERGDDWEGDGRRGTAGPSGSGRQVNDRRHSGDGLLKVRASVELET